MITNEDPMKIPCFGKFVVSKNDLHPRPSVLARQQPWRFGNWVIFGWLEGKDGLQDSKMLSFSLHLH